jgi:hypothetical protein
MKEKSLYSIIEYAMSEYLEKHRDDGGGLVGGRVVDAPSGMALM